MRSSRAAAVAFVLVLGAGWTLLHGCGGEKSTTSATAPSAGKVAPPQRPPETGLFEDVSDGSGIDFVHRTPTGRMDDILESVGCGAVALDYDGDGRVDVYLLQGGRREAANKEGRAPGSNRLYRNLGGGRFEDVTEAAGVGHEGHGFSGAAADYDNDGDVDLFVFNEGPNVLYRNEGDGTFMDVTGQAGVAGAACSVAGTLFDADGDGWLDLYVANYLTFDPGYRLHYAPDVFPGPLAFAAEEDVLYRNEGDGTFEDVSARMGLDLLPGRSMGVVAADFDGDGRSDVFVANDASANFLLRNKGNFLFEEIAMQAGMAFGFHGEATGAMAGVVGDVDLDGLPDVHVTDTKYGSLYHNQGEGRFRDRAYDSGIAALSAQWVSWGGGFLDVDNDGDVDLFLANGDLHHPTGRPDLLLENVGAGRFEDASPKGGRHFRRELLSRGGLILDFDDDGGLDLLVTTIDGPPVLLRNRKANENHWIKLDLRARGHRPALGARVVLQAGERTWTRVLHLPTDYLTQEDARLHFGLGGATKLQSLEVRWPGGAVTRHDDLAVDRVHVLREEGGPR